MVGPTRSPPQTSRLEQHTTHRLAIDRLRCTLDPIEWSQAVIVSGSRVGTVAQQHLNGSGETGFRGVVEGSGAAAIVVLTDAAPVVDARAIAEKRGDVLRIIFATLIAGERQA